MTPIAGWRAVPRTVWALGFVSLCMDVSSEMIHAFLPVFLVVDARRQHRARRRDRGYRRGRGVDHKSSPARSAIGSAGASCSP